MNEKEKPTLEEIKHDLERLKTLDKKLLVFGASAHQYKSYPVSKSELEHLEGELGVRLPEDYRQFLQEIGYGAGPYYGLFGPDSILSEWRDFAYYYYVEPERFPDASKPFPFNHAQAEECFRVIVEKERWVNVVADWPTDGCVPICTQGDAIFTCLVTAGDLTDSIWSTYPDGPDADHGYWLLAEKPTGILHLNLPFSQRVLWPQPTFMEWYNAWLQQCLSDFDILKEKEKEKEKDKGKEKKKGWTFWR
jgi:hypothetical protein